MPKKTTRRRIASALTGVSVAAAAVALVQLPASAAGSTGGSALLPPIPANARHFALPYDKIPAGAVKAKTGPLKAGKRAKAFQTPGSKTKIVNGDIAHSADFPGVVGIQSDFIANDANGNPAWWTSTCTGTVLSPTRVLTAGHCTVDLPYGYTQVIAGRDNLADNTSGFVARVSNTWLHPSYNYQAQVTDPQNTPPKNDVSVLDLKDALPDVYKATDLIAQGAADPAAGQDATIVGYGITKEGGSDSGVLHSATVQTQKDSTCTQPSQFGTQFDPTTMLCAGDVVNHKDTCHGDSGGPIFLGGPAARVEIGVTSWGNVCGGAYYGAYAALNQLSGAVKAQVTNLQPTNLDFTGDGHSDLIVREPGTGYLIVASGAGTLVGTPYIDETSSYDVGFNYYRYLDKSHNYEAYSKLFRVTNWNADGNESIFGRDRNGTLWQWKGDGRGDLVSTTPTKIGSGWNMFTDIVVTNNWNGDGRSNLLGRKADGTLVIYNSDGAGGWENPQGTVIGSGWNQFNTVLTPGSWLGDGHQSLIGRNAAGELWLYNSNGHGGWINPRGTKLGTGWNGMPTFMSPGDFDGDNLVDLIGVRTNGDLYLYPTNGKGAWKNGRGKLLGYSWDYYKAVF
ncbi:Plasminogen [Actinoplanes sp. SE50]|uniref:trypsin-like serine protease n=1 Tax=unclassified Actinoplanes TaxID=2626549 RepID=UPI00023EDCC9|nr:MULTISPECIES: trypsin-like serine protease [unclassified Actinoplanes]AEV89087.1 Plasminogen [Actinoplanes sp. SE50/110]ATO87493.1 Plasminogen [Actinoplanes sp. SE50]SLM04911.1 uncharacterized protein ACSP50_8223 [Actinoplanes sp. SE50/110]